MHLVQILLPINDNDSKPCPQSLFTEITATLASKFGGVTAYSRAPAKGQWVDADHIERDDVIAIEVMVEFVDERWWVDFRQGLERQLQQKEIVVRALPIKRL